MLVGIALIAVGVLLIGVSVWFWRSARPDDPVLGPLEVMGGRQYKQAGEEARKEMLRKARTTVVP